MPNSEQPDTKENKDKDSFDEERLDSKLKNKAFQEAKSANDTNFKSFSEGLEAVDKFDIVGISNENTEAIESENSNPVSNTQKNNSDSTSIKETSKESFQSFSDGLDSVDKFSISGAGKIDSSVSYMPLAKYLNHQDCIANKGNLVKKSKTLAELLNRLEKCAWLDQITVYIHSKEYPCEYDLREHNIHLDLTKSEQDQLLDQVHQLYHAAHRYINKLYVEGPLSEELFVDTFYWSEVGALLTELNIKQELELKEASGIGFKIKMEKNRFRQVYIEEILSIGTLEDLRESLTDALNRDDFLNKLSLKAVLTTFHQNYLRTFESSKEEAMKLLSETISNGIDPNKI